MACALRSSVRNVKLVIEYDGTAYCGWQTQKNGPTVQQTLEKAIKDVVGGDVKLYGSGRTDAGVHALGQTANFKTESDIPCDNVRDAINTHLPADIVVLSADDVSDDFHARYSARSKAYRYTILNRSVPTALQRERCHFVRVPLDMARMKEAAQAFVGQHDFSAFCSETPDNAVRTVSRVDVMKQGNYVKVEIEADGFLYNMVRRIIGTLVEVGRGKNVDIAGLLQNDDGIPGGPTLPAVGLCLVEVKY
jgi:tRNA pseudouridine38-40 synthase